MRSRSLNVNGKQGQKATEEAVSEKTPSSGTQPRTVATAGAEKKKKKKEKQKSKGSSSSGEKTITSAEGVMARKNRIDWARNVATTKKARVLAKEFVNGLRAYKTPDAPCTAAEKNEAKNRYKDIWCIDATRVVLRILPPNKSDYIHANWVKIPQGNNYICTQAPLEETCEDFWHMVAQEKAPIIAMLCDFNEVTAAQGAVSLEKCAPYFPTGPKEVKKFGLYTITHMGWLDELRNNEGFKISKFKIDHKGKELHNVKHVLMTSWPDHLCPVHSKPVLDLWKWIDRNAFKKPVVLHCSAGVGRTGTLVAFELADQCIGKKSTTNLLDVIKELRTMRYGLVQSHVQYLFLHVMLIEFYKEKYNIAEPVAEDAFIEEYRKHVRKKLEKQAAMANAAAGGGNANPDDDE